MSFLQEPRKLVSCTHIVSRVLHVCNCNHRVHWLKLKPLYHLSMPLAWFCIWMPYQVWSTCSFSSFHSHNIVQQFSMDKYYLLKNHNYVRKLVLDGFDSVTIFFHPFVPFSWIENLFSFLSISMRQMIKALALESSFPPSMLRKMEYLLPWSLFQDSCNPTNH